MNSTPNKTNLNAKTHRKNETMKKSSWVLFAILSAVLIIMILTLGFIQAPYFTFAMLSISLSAFLYLFTEQWITHAAVEFENRFWSFMAFCLASSCILLPDSPMKFPGDRMELPLLIIMMFTFLAHNYDRHLRRLVLRRIPNILRINSTTFGTNDRESAAQKLNELKHLLESIDLRLMSSTILNICFLTTVVFTERKIISIFNDASKEELNLIISNIGLGHVFYKVKDHNITNIPSRTKLLKILAEDRITDLQVLARAMLIDGLQRMKLSANRHTEKFVLRIIQCTKDCELSELKCLTDAKGDVNSLHRLIFIDIRNESIRKSILQHIQVQANVVKALHRLEGNKGKEVIKRSWRKILSDIDDTLYCSDGSWPAGIDQSYPKKAIYPGVLAFYRELDLGIRGKLEWDPKDIGNLVFLSARPHVYKDVAEGSAYKKFQELQRVRTLYTCPSLLTGDLDTGSQFIMRGDLSALAVKKYENFTQYLQLYPEFSCIFIGDNGQGDVRTAEMVLDDNAIKSFLSRVYIHEVQPLHQTFAKYEDSKKRYNNPKICYFKSYVEAAIDAYRQNLILSVALRRIMEEAVKDFQFIPVDNWQTEWIGSNPSRSFDPLQTTRIFFTSSAQTAKKKCRRMKSLTNQSMLALEKKSGAVKRENRLRELNISLERGNLILKSLKIEPVALIEHVQTFQIGCIIATAFGDAMVLEFRHYDGIHKLEVIHSPSKDDISSKTSPSSKSDSMKSHLFLYVTTASLMMLDINC